MNRAYSHPEALLRVWIAVLLAPVAWGLALGILYSLTDETCARGDHAAMTGVAAICVLLAVVPGPLAWSWRHRIDITHRAGERLCFMLELATGASAIFALVTLLSAVPIFLLGACRT